MNDITVPNTKLTQHIQEHPVLSDVLEDGKLQGKAQAAAAFCAAYVNTLLGARDPGYLLKCTPESVRAAAIQAASLGIVPGVQGAAHAYLVPRAARKGAPPSLRLELTHLGYAELAGRDGYTLMPAIILDDEQFDHDCGEVTSHKMRPDRARLQVSGLARIKCGYLSIKKGGALVGRPMVPASEIMTAYTAATSQGEHGGQTWKSHPLEMAMKTVVKWCARRGLFPLPLAALDEGPMFADGEVEQVQQPTRLPPVQTVQDAEFEEGEIGPSLLETVQQMLAQAYARERVDNDIPDRGKGEAEQADWDKAYGDRWAQVVRKFRADMGIKMKPEQMAPAQIEELAGKLRAYLEIRGGGAK